MDDECDRTSERASLCVCASRYFRLASPLTHAFSLAWCFVCVDACCASAHKVASLREPDMRAAESERGREEGEAHVAVGQKVPLLQAAAACERENERESSSSSHTQSLLPCLASLVRFSLAAAAALHLTRRTQSNYPDAQLTRLPLLLRLTLIPPDVEGGKRVVDDAFFS